MSDYTPAPEGIDTTTESVPPAYDPTATIVVDPTYRYNRPSQFPMVMTAEALSDKLVSLNDEEKIRKSFQATTSAYRESNNNVREYLLENYDALEEHADQIAEILGIELTRVVTATIQVEVTVEFDAPRGVEIDEYNVLEFFELDVRIESTGSTTINNYYHSDGSVDSVELY